MPSRIYLVFLFLVTLLNTISVRAQDPAPDLGWEVITPGIEYQKFMLPDPNNVFVVRMDRANQNLTLESMIAQGKLVEGRETVSEMYSRYNQALNFWGGRNNPATWDMRNQAVVAINGSYFDWNSGTPQGGQVYSGWYAKRYDNLGGWSGFVWKLDRTFFIGECVNNQADKQVIAYPATGKMQKITRINDSRADNNLVIFNPQFDSRTGTDNSGVEVLVEMERPTMILPFDAHAKGYVRQITVGKGNSWIPFNSIILSAKGTAADTLLANVQIGSEIQVSQEITSYKSDCATKDTLDWTKTFASVQGAFYYLKDGVIRDFDDPGATSRQPRTAIAYGSQYVYFIVVDGRDNDHSLGMSIHNLAMFTQNVLGATHGVAQDGGGSSTLVINGMVVNNTYCNIYTCGDYFKRYIPFVTKNNNGGQSAQPQVRDIVISLAGVERAVGNGILMLVAQPGAFSTLYSPGDSVTTVSAAELRLGPGTNYESFSTIPQGTHGVVAEQMNNLEGVLAKSKYWWYVNFNGVYGWVQETALTGVPR